MKYKYDFKPIRTGSAQRLYACGALRGQLDFLDKDLLRVALYPAEQRLFPTYSVCPGDCAMPIKGRDRLSTEGFPLSAPVCRVGDGYELFRLGDIEIRLDLSCFRLSYALNGQPLFADRDGLSYNFGGELGEGAAHYVTRSPGERVFGLGDKTGPVNKAGRHYRISATDAMGFDASSSDPLYKHVPFFFCVNNTGSYGIFYDTHAQAELDFGCEINNYYGPYQYFRCEETALVYYVFFGDPAGIVQRFTRLCGRPAFPPKWTLDYCGSTMSYTDADGADEKLRGFIDLCAQHGIVCSGFYLSSGYTSIGDKRYVFTWNRDKIPDPAGLCRRFKQSGMELVANIKPAFLTDHPLYETIAENGWFLHDADNRPAVVPFWSGMGSYLDFTNADAFRFWTRMVREQLIRFGIRCTWNDNNEYDICDRSILADGFGHPTPAYLIRPVFPALMAMASYAAQCEDSDARQFLVTRAGCAGLTRLAQTWSGDNRTAFSDLRYQHKQSMTFALSGITNVGHDIGGFAGDRPAPELFLRWLQYGVFLPRFVIHSWNPDGVPTMPWSYPEHMDAVRALFAFRHMLKPYLYDALYRMHAQYLPTLSPLFLTYPDADIESDCYLCGTDLLVANVFDEGAAAVRVDLPENNGGWYAGDAYYPGGTRCELDCPADGLPVYFCRGGSVVVRDRSPYGSDAPEQDVYTVYPLDEGVFGREYFNDDGQSSAYLQDDCMLLRFTVRCTEDAVTVSYAHLGLRKPEPDVILCDRRKRPLIIEAE